MAVEQEKELFPIYEKKLPEISARLMDDFKLAMLLIDTQPIRNLEYTHGKHIYDNIISALQKSLLELQQQKMIRHDDIILLNTEGGDIFYIFLSAKRKEGQFFVRDYDHLSERIASYLNHRLFPLIFPLLKSNPGLNIGYAVAFHNPSVKESRLIQTLISDAEQMAHYQEIKKKMARKEDVYRLIVDKKLTVSFQPVVDCMNQSVIGYEAFSHGPPGTEYEEPAILFSIAREIGLLYELDWLCKVRIFIEAHDFQPGMKLFVNIFSSSIPHSESRLKYLEELLGDTSLANHDIVFEIADPLALENFSFLNKIIATYGERINLAVKIADSWMLADLSLLKKLRVNYIKLDKSLIRDLHNDHQKKDVLYSLINITRVMQTELIAEGVENQEELKTLLKAGIKLAQGNFFLKPGELSPEVTLSKVLMEEDFFKNKMLSSIYNKRGLDYFHKGLFDQAILEFTKALEVNPDDLDILYSLARAYYEDKAYPAALKELDKILRLDAGYADAYFTRALIQEKYGNTAEARTALEKYLDTAPAVSHTNIELVKKKLEKLSKQKN